MYIYTSKISNEIKYPSFPNNSIFYPILQLAESPAQAYHDTVFIAQLIHAMEPKKIADLGCYTGILSVFVEDLLRNANSNHSGLSEWSLADNFEFLLDLKRCIEDPTYNGNELNKILVPQWKNTIAAQKSYITKPPVTANELHSFLSSFCSSHGVNIPNISSIEDNIKNLKNKYDFIIYDLFGSQYTIDIASYIITELLNDDGIIVFDDMKPRHPQQMALFVTILNTMPVVPIAFNSAKVAVIKSPMVKKHQIMESRMIHRLPTNFSTAYYYWNSFENPIFGKTFSLKDHL